MLLEDRIRQSFTAALDEARGTLEAELKATLASVHEESERARDAAVAEARSATEAELTRAFDDEKAAIAASHESALHEVRSAAEAQLTSLRQEGEAELATVRNHIELGQLEVQRLREQAEVAAAALREADQLRVQAADSAALVAADAASAVARRVLDGVKALDAATSLTEVLDALTATSAAETGRAAMLVVKGDRLIGWRTSGFGALDSQPRSVEASSDNADALMRAVATGRPVVTGTGPASSVPAFADADGDRAGIAVPLMVGGRAVAVIYADREGTAPDASPSHAVIETAVRHAGRCLEALTVQRAVQARASAAGARVSTPA